MSYLKEASDQFEEPLLDFSSTFFWEYHNLEDLELPKINDNNTSNTKENTQNSGNKNFEMTKKKAGRKRINDNKKEQKDEHVHSKESKDNIIRKIQVHFHNFLLLFINEIIINYGLDKKFQFIDIDYTYKKNIKKEDFEKLKSKEIHQILCQNISPKFRKISKIDKEINNKIYSEVIKYDSIRRILSERYINIFRNIYYVNKRVINDYDLNIKLSNNIKTYQDLLEENSDYIEKIKKEVKDNYLPKKLFKLK